MPRLLALALGLVMAAATATAAPTDISRVQLKALLAGQEPVVLVDVRSPEEFAGGHIPGAINIPYQQLPARAGELEKYRADGKVVLYCRSGRRVGLAAEALESRGFRGLLHLEGDMPGWQQAGEPVAPCPAC